MSKRYQLLIPLFLFTIVFAVKSSHGQGVTTAALSGVVTGDSGGPLVGANIIVVYEPTQTKYGISTRSGGAYNIPNMKIGGPYSVTISFVGFQSITRTDVFLSLGQNLRLNVSLAELAVEAGAITVTADQDNVLNADRTGAATTVTIEQVKLLPSINRTTRDLTRLDPRSDGNLSFGGRNWLFNNISLDGSYFNNPFGLDAPEPGGQSNAQPVPFESIEQVQVSVAPFDVREGGFTGAGINQVTKSGTNEFTGAVYFYGRNEDLVGNEVDGEEVVKDPNLDFTQIGISGSGPIIRDKLFFFANVEFERREDPGSNFTARRGPTAGPGESRVSADVMESIANRLKTAYGYDPGVFEGYSHDTENDKVLLKLNWNINDRNNMWIRYNYLDAFREQGPHPFVLSFAGTGRGPNETSLPFSNSGYTINNELHSIALELNTRGSNFSNRFFASYNRFRDKRVPFSVDFPTLEIGEGGITYTTAGHEPFSIHNILDQDVIQIANNFSLFKGNHVITVGAGFEYFDFFNSFNIFRHGLFGLPFAATTFFSLDDFFEATDPDNPDQMDLNGMIGGGPFKGEKIEVGQFSVYGQDEYIVNDKLNLIYGIRVDIPTYFTDPVANPFSTGLTLKDEDGNPETVDQADLAGGTPLLSPRIGFNYDVTGTRSTQLRGGAGIFTGRVPFVWIGNVITNPGANPNLFPISSTKIVTREGEDEDPTSATGGPEEDTILQGSFDLNAMTSDFNWPQVMTFDLAVDHELPGDILGTFEVLYSKDINSVYVRNADLADAKGTLKDGRPYFGARTFENELNSDFGAGAYVIDNRSDGYNFTATAQFRKEFDSGLKTQLAYTFLQSKNLFKSTEIASVLFSESPVQGNPNRPNLSYSEFGNRHRIIGSGTYSKSWSPRTATHVGFFFEIAEGNTFRGSGGNRYSFTYAGDVNGDGFTGNDLIFIPNDATNRDEILFAANGTATAVLQAAGFEAFIRQDDYLSNNRGKVAERFGAINPWFTNIDIKIAQDFIFNVKGRRQKFQISLDIQNFANLLNSSWGVRKVAPATSTSPLTLVDWAANGEPIFNFSGATKTYVDDFNEASRWQAQLGLRYEF